MNTEIAGFIYMGIVSDTNRFLYNCNFKTFSYVSELIKKYKLDIEDLYRKVYAKPLSEMRLMGHIASSLRVDKYGFASIEIDEEIIESLGADISSASNMINDFNNINEIIVWTFVSFDRKNNQYRVNIRSRGPVINEVAEKLNNAKKNNKRIICVGTTSLRTLEANIQKYKEFKPTKEETDIFIYPPHEFKSCDALITNFHLPKSTLVMLVSAFSSVDIIKEAYKHAQSEKYKFFSFGDAMFLTKEEL